jgi:hypothetical protein
MVEEEEERIWEDRGVVKESLTIFQLPAWSRNKYNRASVRAKMPALVDRKFNLAAFFRKSLDGKCIRG